MPQRAGSGLARACVEARDALAVATALAEAAAAMTAVTTTAPTAMMTTTRRAGTGAGA
jgi:hypothetical protein